MIIHTREGHRADLTDCPPAKKARGRLTAGIGDPGPMGRILVRGEEGHDIVKELYPEPGEPVVDKPGKGAFFATDLDGILKHRGITHLVVCGVTTEVCVNTTVREANDRGYDCLVLEDCVASYFPEFQKVGPRDDQGAGRHLRLGVGLRALPRGPGQGAVNPATGGRMAGATTTGASGPLVGAGRLERVLRPLHQRRAERHRAHRADARRRQAPRRSRLRPHPPGARHRAAARQPLLRLARVPPGQERAARHGHGDAVRPERAAHVHRRLPDHASRRPQDGQSRRRVAGRARLVLRHRRHHPARRLRRARPSGSTRRARPCSGTLAGISITFISMRPAFQSWEVPWIAFISLAIIMVSWMANVSLPGNVPGGLAAVIIGTAVAWIAAMLGWSGLMQPTAVGAGPQPVRPAAAHPVGRRLRRASRHRPAARDRHPARHLQLHRGDEQRRERGSGRRQLQPAQDPARRRHRRGGRLAPRQPLPAGRLHRAPRLEGRRRAHRLLRRHRASASRWSASSA